MAEYQRYIHALEKMHDWLDVDLVHNCFLMGEEVGELFKAVRRYERYYESDDRAPGRQEEAEDGASRKTELAEELVDVMNYIMAIANRVGVDLEQAFRKKNARNQRRTWKG